MTCKINLTITQSCKRTTTTNLAYNHKQLLLTEAQVSEGFAVPRVVLQELAGIPVIPVKPQE